MVAFITSYQRLGVIRQLMKMDLDKVVRVCVDGIYYHKHDFELTGVFRHKDDIKFGNEAGDCYISGVVMPEMEDEGGLEPPRGEMEDEGVEPRDHHATELHLGAGGSGKTHSVLYKTRGL